jgi:hypothetical protein
MKRFLPILLVLALAQTACALPFFVEPTATPTEIVLPTDTPTPAATSTSTSTPLPTEPPTATLPPSETPEPSETPTPTATATQLPFDPAAEYGSPTLFDSMDSDRNWASGSGGMPNDQNIRLALGGGRLHVTGKLAEWDTWWFTSPTPSDFFIQMKVETGNCTGKQAYGLIVRGPQTAGGEARGYIFTFSCDGSYRLERLDNTAPYTTVELIPWTESDYINAGDNETNVIGIRMVGADITLYANGFEIDDLDDDQYLTGRFGLFVNAGPPGNYSFDVDELSYWDL